MSTTVEKISSNKVKLSFDIDAAKFDEAMSKAYIKVRGQVAIPGFRKGHAPRKMIENMYGEGVFYDEAFELIFDEVYGPAIDENKIEVVDRPQVDIQQIGAGKNLQFTCEVFVKPDVTLGEYKGIEVEKVDAAVKPEDVEAELKKVQEQNARLLTVEDRPVADGDQTVIDFEGFVDGKTFDGGKAADYPLTIGSHSFIDTFEEQLVGKNIGEECEINVTFPEEYHAAELAGKPATFKVTVKEIKVKELPELDDEFAGEVSEFDTLDEYKKDIEAKILERKQKEAASENENRVVDKVVAGASMEIPDRMVEGQIDNMVQDTARRMESQGLNMDLYMKYTGMTMEQMREQMKPQALKRIQTRLVLEEVVKAENLQVSDERLDEEIAKMAAAYQMEADKLKGYMSDRDKDQMKEDIAVQEAVDFLVAEAKLV